MCQSHSHHDHNHNHDHGHSHGNQRINLLLYGGAVILYIASRMVDQQPLNLILTLGVMVFAGHHVILEGFSDTIRQTKANKRLTPNVHVLMALAALGSLLIQEYHEGALLILIFAGAHFLEDYAEGKSSKEIKKLLSMQPTTARRMNDDGSVEIVAASDLKIGDRIQILNGDQIPADGMITAGHSSVNQASITGESIPVDKTIGDTVFGASINGNGVLEVAITKAANDTVIANIIKMVSQAQSDVSKTAAFIKKLEPTYVNAVLILAPIFYLFGRFGMQWDSVMAFYKTMVFLIVASPCALAATDIPATLSAISTLARNGVLFKGGSTLSNLSDVKAVAFDKTGTLTKGYPEVVAMIETDATQNYDVLYDILYSMERQNNHPLAQAIVNKLGNRTHLAIENETIIGEGIRTNYEGKSYFVGKKTMAKNGALALEATAQRLQENGNTLVYFGEGDCVLLVLGIVDMPKESAHKALEYLHSASIKTVMISGDGQKTAQAIGNGIGIDIVKGDVMPNHKAAIIQDLQKTYGVVAMLGDGVNDAPALVQADIGFAMGNGTDIAIDVADAVLVENDLMKFITTLKVAKKLRRVVVQNIIFAMAVVVFLVSMNVLGQMDMTGAVIVHEGSTFVVLLNGLRLLRDVSAS